MKIINIGFIDTLPNIENKYLMKKWKIFLDYLTQKYSTIIHLHNVSQKNIKLFLKEIENNKIIIKKTKYTTYTSFLSSSLVSFFIYLDNISNENNCFFLIDQYTMPIFTNSQYIYQHIDEMISEKMNYILPGSQWIILDQQFINLIKNNIL